MSARIRLRFPIVVGVVGFAAAGGCGYLGIEPVVDDGGSSATGGQQEGDGDGDGDGDGAGGFQNGSGGSLLPMGGGSSFGGFGGGAFGGAGNYDVPSVPCSFACAEPFLLYRSFEDGLPLAGIKEDAGATVELTTEFVYDQDYALAVTQGAPETDAQITEQISRVVGAHIYYRAWLFVPEGALAEWLKVLAFNGILTEGIDVNLTAEGAAEIYSQITGQSAISRSGVVPEGEWFCLRTATFVDNVNGTVEVAVNDRTVARAENWDTLPGAEISNIVYGIAETGPEQTGATLYFDEVVASTQPISCSLGRDD